MGRNIEGVVYLGMEVGRETDAGAVWTVGREGVGQPAVGEGELGEDPVLGLHLPVVSQPAGEPRVLDLGNKIKWLSSARRVASEGEGGLQMT